MRFQRTDFFASGVAVRAVFRWSWRASGRYRSVSSRGASSSRLRGSSGRSDNRKPAGIGWRGRAVPEGGSCARTTGDLHVGAHGCNEGYQLAAVSPGISPEEDRELVKWGPGHDALHSGLSAAESVNYHQMQSGAHCVSQTVSAGREYSGRGGQRIYTQMFLVPEELFQRFGWNPFRVLEALVVSGRCAVLQQIPPRLEAIELVGLRLAREPVEPGTGRVPDRPSPAGRPRSRCFDNAVTGSCAPISGKRLLSALVDLLPPQLRTGFPLTTGLRVSGSRPFRLTLLPHDREEMRRAIRQVYVWRCWTSRPIRPPNSCLTADGRS